jgi:hypothetical protein
MVFADTLDMAKIYTSIADMKKIIRQAGNTILVDALVTKNDPLRIKIAKTEALYIVEQAGINTCLMELSSGEFLMTYSD